MASRLVKLTVIKRGTRGAVAFDRETGNRFELPGAALDERSIADTTGAGDNFDAGFLFAWLKGAPLNRCVELGTRCGISSLACMGGIEGQLPAAGSSTDMAERDTVRIGLVGSQFITTIHAEALRMVPQAEVLAVMSPTEGHARDFASKHGIARHFQDLDAMLAMDANRHGGRRRTQLRALRDRGKGRRAGKHVVMEKPLCLNLAEADRMIAACARPASS